MSRTRLVGFLVTLTFVFLAATDASAMYNPATGTFLNRDPGPGGPTRLGMVMHVPRSQFIQRDAPNQYTDGMNLYEYARSRPSLLVDPMGTMSGLTCCLNKCDQDAWNGFTGCVKRVFGYSSDAMQKCQDILDYVTPEDVARELAHACFLGVMTTGALYWDGCVFYWGGWKTQCRVGCALKYW